MERSKRHRLGRMCVATSSATVTSRCLPSCEKSLNMHASTSPAYLHPDPKRVATSRVGRRNIWSSVREHQRHSLGVAFNSGDEHALPVVEETKKREAAERCTAKCDGL